jgi:hypothetical protein
MGMMRGPMGMMGMGMMRPGMGSARWMMMDGPGYGSRRARSYRDYEPPSHHVKSTRPKPVPVTAPTQARVATPAGSAAAKPQGDVSSQRGLPGNSVASVQPSGAQSAQIPQPVKAAPVINQPVAPPAAAQTESEAALPVRITPETRPHNCLTKLYLKDGTVILQDFCTLEQAVIKQGATSYAQPQPRPEPQPQIQSHPAQLARTR